MDIHRCRFVPYPASAVNAVAFSHSYLPATSRKASHRHVAVRLAIGRANGDLEIWNPLNGAWFQELIIPGGKDRSIDGLVWVTDPDEVTSDGKIIHGKSRLFSIGYTTTITEWDLAKARAKKHASGQHGDIWCLAVQPLPSGDALSTAAGQSRKLVAGTSDGSLILYSIEDDDLRFQRAMFKTPTKKVKMVSITFQSRHVVIVGCSDSTIRAYDVRNGATIRHMTLGSDLAGGSKGIIVWAVACLRNGDIVSGDSTGQICIWDGKTYTQAQRIQSHTQDVLSLATNFDGTKIFSGGMDRRTVLYEPMPGHAGRWAKVWHRRYHSHDVKTMASFEKKGMSVVVSGGMFALLKRLLKLIFNHPIGPDATPVVLPLQGAGKEYHRTLSHLPQRTPLQSAPKARFIISWWEREVQIWQLLKPLKEVVNGSSVVESDTAKNYKRIGRILIKGESNITSAAISEDGTLLVVSTASDVKAFKLELAQSPDEPLRISKVDVAANSRGATKVQISPDRNWVCWVEEGSRVMVAGVTTVESARGSSYAIPRPSPLKRLRRSISKYSLLGGLGAYDRSVLHIAFSADSKMLAVADLAGYIDTWVLRGPESARLQNGVSVENDDDAVSTASLGDSSDEDEVEEQDSRWIRNPRATLIPKLSAEPAYLSFSNQTPGSVSRDDGPEVDDYTLLAITTSRQILAFNPLRGALSDWSRRNPYAKLPEKLRTTRDLVRGALWQGSRVWIYGASHLFMLDLSTDLVPEIVSTMDGDKQQQGIKRKRRGPDGGAGGKMEKHSRVPQKLRMAVVAEGDEKWADVDMADADEPKSGATSSGLDEDEDEEDDEEGEGMDGSGLQLMREHQEANGNGADKKDERMPWWLTYKYRSILGIVPLEPLGEEGQDEQDGPSPLEVAIVERPIWDVDLPPRYFGEGEMER